MLTQKKECFKFGIYEHRIMKGKISNVFKYVTFNFFSFEMKRSFSARISCYQIIFSTTLSAWRKLSPQPNPQLSPAQRWHLARSTGTRPGPVQLNASDALPYVGLCTPSSTRPVPVVRVAGPWRYGRDAERSHGTCVNAKFLTSAAILIASEDKCLFYFSNYWWWCSQHNDSLLQINMCFNIRYMFQI